METPEVSSPTSEAEVNAAAQVELAAAAEQAGQTNVEKTVADPASVQSSSPQKDATTGQAAFDAQKSYEQLQKQYAETQKWATQQSQMRSQFEKELSTIKAQHAEVAKKLADATEAPFDLEQFNKDFVKNGPKAFDPYFEKKLSDVKGQYEPKINEQAQMIQGLQADLTIMQKRADSKNFPNFNELESKMVEILNSPNCPVDKNLPLAEKLDAVYNLAKTSNSTEATKEAKTAVATGGKGVSTTPADLHSMPIDKLEALVKQMYGVADRD
jgi:plasmid maintenance system killer protein